MIPQSLHKAMLAELHKEYMGVSHMKALAHSHVWWKGLDKDLEELGKSYRACLAVKLSLAKAPWPDHPWQ